jgi:hypothetical protein
VDPADVLWIGGATGAGKTTISPALAFRHDLQLCNVDHRTYTHLRRVRVPPAVAGDLPPAILVEHVLDFARDRFELVLEDLAALPPSPGAIAEGPFLLPSLVPPGADAPFVCECGRAGCADEIELTLEDYLRVGADRSPLRRPRS